MGAMSPPGRAVLIVTARRDDRRVLFDVIDTELREVMIHTASDLAHAHRYLDDGMPLALVIAEFRGEPDEVVNFCSSVQHSQVPIIGVIGDGHEPQRWGYFNHPPGVVAWVRSPVLSSEVLFRVRQTLAGQPAAAGVAHADYRFAFASSIDGIVVSDLDSGRIIEVNDAFVARGGRSGADAVGQPLGSIDVDHSKEQRQLFADRLAEEGQVSYRFSWRTADNTPLLAQTHARLVMRGDRRVRVDFIRDLSPVKQVEQDLALLRNLLTNLDVDGDLQPALIQLIHGMQLDLAAVLQERREDGSCIEVLGSAWGEEYRGKRPDLADTSVVRLVLQGKPVVHLGGTGRLGEMAQLIQETGFGSFVGLPLVDARRDVLGALILAARKPISRTIGGMDVIRIVASRFAFALQLRRAEDAGRATGLRDGLTRLPNRLLFNERLQSVLRSSDRTGEIFAVMFVDLDRFKTINDSLGHGVGDHVLKAVARRLSRSIGKADTVARYAGDEFTLLLRHVVERRDALRVAERIIQAMDDPLILADETELKVTVSMGLSFYPDDGGDADALLKHADLAMYSAKNQQGRSSIQAYEAVPEESHKQRVALERQLRVAEDNGELRVYYQPQIDAYSEDIVGFEALVRWQHPELGMIGPGFFIPIAEETGLIASIGTWVLRTACTQVRQWQQRFQLPLRVGVNVSALQLQQDNIVEQIRQALGDSGLSPSLLELEVTESMDVRQISGLTRKLAAFRAMGCSVAIDDFGTGQASLDYLRRFPANRVKIDQTFVRNIGIDPDDEAIVRATISMAHSLHHKVVAEGVETEDHLEFLRSHHCEELQGYLFCQPLPTADMEALLVERERVYAGSFPLVQNL